MHNNEGAGLNVKNRKSPYFNVGVSVCFHICYVDVRCKCISVENEKECNLINMPSGRGLVWFGC